MKAVSNSTPIIYLAKVNKLDLLKRIYEEVYVCSAVWQDLIYPLLHAKPISEDIPIILKAKEEGWLKLKDPETKEALNLRNEMIAQGMGSGESNSIALAKELKAIFLANDKLAIETAKQYRVEARWFTKILHDALKAGFIKNIKQYTFLLDACRKKGLYVSKRQRERAIQTAQKNSQMKTSYTVTKKKLRPSVMPSKNPILPLQLSPTVSQSLKLPAKIRFKNKTTPEHANTRKTRNKVTQTSSIPKPFPPSEPTSTPSEPKTNQSRSAWWW